jgi:hypothetical protein
MNMLLVSTDKGLEYVVEVENRDEGVQGWLTNPLAEIIWFVDEYSVDYDDLEACTLELVYECFVNEYFYQIKVSAPEYDVFARAWHDGYIRQEQVSGA